MNWKLLSIKIRLSGLPRIDKGCFMNSISRMQKKHTQNNHFNLFNIQKSKAFDNDIAFICYEKYVNHPFLDVRVQIKNRK